MNLTREKQPQMNTDGTQMNTDGKWLEAEGKGMITRRATPVVEGRELRRGGCVSFKPIFVGCHWREGWSEEHSQDWLCH
jgi:hypothetical protein